MLGRLIKHEFRATSKLMWPIFGGMVLLALITRFVAVPVFCSSNNFIVNAIGFLILFAFGLGLFVLGFAPLVVSGGRFKSNILGSEGYLANTLPVSSYQHINAKLITNAVWYALCGLLYIVICFLMVAQADNLPNFFSGFKGLLGTFRDLSGDDARVVGNAFFIGIELLIDFVVLISLFTIAVYASYAIGYAANKRKTLWTVLLIYGFFHVIVWFGIGSLLIVGRADFRVDEFENILEAMHAFQGCLGWEFLFMIALGTVFYFVTNYFITRKLNLE